MAVGAVPCAGTVVPLDLIQDKRPPLFPFLVSLAHDWTGCRPANAFAVNLLLLAVLFGLIHVWLLPSHGIAAALAGPLLVFGAPLVITAACSGGFELLALVMLTAVSLAARDYAASPSPSRAGLLLATVAVAAHARYETGVLAVAVAALALWRGRGRGAASLGVVAIGAALPALGTPLLWLYAHGQRADFYPEAAGRPLLAMGYLAEHLPGLLRAVFLTGGPWPIALPWLGALAWLWRWRRREVGFADALVLVPVVGATGIVLAWFFGAVEETGAVRLYLPLGLAAALAPLVAVRWLPRSWRAPAALGFAAAVALWRGADLASGRAVPEQPTARAVAAIRAAAHAQDAPGTLWVTFAAQALVVDGLAAISPRSLERRAADLQVLRARGDVRRILALETPWDEAFAPAFGSLRPWLAAGRAERIADVPGALPVTVWRLSP